MPEGGEVKTEREGKEETCKEKKKTNVGHRIGGGHSVW